MQQTATENEKQLIDELNHLIALEYDAISAYEAAIQRLDADAFKSKFEQFLVDHQSHEQDLTRAVSMLGGTPRTRGDIKQLLTKGRVVLANLAGDKAILKAMKANEDDTNRKYEDSVNKCRRLAPLLIQQTLVRALEDERRHREWIVSVIEAL